MNQPDQPLGNDLAHAILAQWLNTLLHESCLTTLQRCCGSLRWCEEMEESRPFFSDVDVLEKSAAIWNTLDLCDYQEAFASPPQNPESPSTVSSLNEHLGDKEIAIAAAQELAAITRRLKNLIG
jgi:hypothetical protein